MDDATRTYELLGGLLRDLQRFATTEYHRNNSAEVSYELKVMNSHLATLASRLDMGEKSAAKDWKCHLPDCPNRGQLRKLKRKVDVLKDREYFAYNHFITGNLSRILGLVELVVMELNGARYEKIHELVIKLREEHEQLRAQIGKILEGGLEGRNGGDK